MSRKFNKIYVPTMEGYRFLKLRTASYKSSNIRLTGWEPNITHRQTLPFRTLKRRLPHNFIVSGS